MRRIARAAPVWLGLVLAAASTADAQRGTADASALAARPPAPPFAIDASRIVDDSLTYDVLVTTDRATMPVGTHAMTITGSVFATRPAWTVVEQRVSRSPFVERAATDTVLLSRETLAPLRWEGQAGGARFVAAFANDTVYGATSAGEMRGSFRAVTHGQAVTTEGALDLLLRASALAPGWAADASLLVADLDTMRVVPLQAWVEREAQLDLGAGVRDVWVIRARAGSAERLLWVEKSTQRVLRAATAAPHMPGMVYERVLVEPQ